MYTVMYSLTAVGGIQYTTEMARQNSKKGPKVGRDTMRTKVIEQLVMGGSSSGPGTTAVAAVTNASGVYSGSYILNTSGLSSATLVSGAYVTGAIANVDPPHLRKLYNMAQDFKYYRVLSGKFSLVPNVGTTQQGVVVLASSRDVLDAGQSAQVAYASSATYKTFNLSLGKTMSIPLDVDSSWKKVTGALSIPGNTYPFYNGSNTMLVPANTVNDLSFSGVMCSINNAGSSINAGFLTVEYEVEFKGIIDSNINS